MHPTRHPALDLPEVITAIGSFLPRKSIVACLQLNFSFHSLLAPFIYSNLKIFSRRSVTKRPPTQTLVRYASLVHDLSINSFVSLAYLTAGYRNLRSISFSSHRANQSDQLGTDDEILDALLQLVQDNPGLKAWRLDDPWPQIPAIIWKAVAERTTELDALCLKNTTVSEEARPWFLKACRKTRQLVLWRVTIQGSESNNDFTGHTDASSSLFPPRSVHFNNVSGVSMLEQLVFLSCCPHLQDVLWEPVSLHTLLQLQKSTEQEVLSMRAEIRRFFQSTTWPHLRSVNIEDYGDYSDCALAMSLMDECLGHILKSILPGRLERLACMGSVIGTAGLTSLSRHFSNLSVLNARGCEVISSPVIQQLLESCPQLTRIDAIGLHIRDIRKGGPWICTRMVDLCFSINLWLEQGDADWRDFACSPLVDKYQDALETARFLQDQHYVFNRLARLTVLECLDVQVLPLRFNGVRGSGGSDMIHYGELDFRISHGLEMLSALKELRYLDFTATYQRLDKEDVEMMVAQWPKLGLLSGRLNSDEQIDINLGEYLDEHNIDRGLLE
ncbi:hypothetical protein BG015_006965 [Linnemannia schmuckeri]|uniref:F-box domain-containing protein n=1 Tax=Linnemannia schmuckeri TaxID=64567 RepID=A0A9P5S1V9_9FUNG|nr:hypothetical protein BG015_006965 [Linnemannia schmuckeri]